MRLFIWFSSLILLSMNACTLWQKAAQQKFFLRYNEKTGALSINADNASLYNILQTLREKHQVDVVVPGMLEDLPVTTSFKNLPLPAGLEKILPAGARYFFSTGKSEPSFSGKTGAKSGENRLAQGKPIKDKTIPLSKEKRLVMKQPDRKGADPIRPELSAKAKTQAYDVSVTKRPKESRQVVIRDSSFYAHLALSINDRGEVRIQQMSQLPGPLVQTTLVNGPFIVVATVGGKVIATASMQDPLFQESLMFNGRHEPDNKPKRATEGSFSISLPATFLNPETLANAQIRFYLLENVGEMPANLTPDTFQAFERSAKQVGEISSITLREALNNLNKK